MHGVTVQSLKQLVCMYTVFPIAAMCNFCECCPCNDLISLYGAVSCIKQSTIQHPGCSNLKWSRRSAWDHCPAQIPHPKLWSAYISLSFDNAPVDPKYLEVRRSAVYRLSTGLTLWCPLLHMGTAIRHLVPDMVKLSFVIFGIRALWRSVLSVRVPGC